MRPVSAAEHRDLRAGWTLGQNHGDSAILLDKERIPHGVLALEKISGLQEKIPTEPQPPITAEGPTAPANRSNRWPNPHQRKSRYRAAVCCPKCEAGLQKTRRALNTDIRDLFKSEGRLVDDEFLD